MQAVLLPGDKEVVVTEVPDPKPGPGEVLVAMKAAGICGSDLKLYRDTREGRAALKDIVPGHEPAGIIVELGPGVVDWKVGDRVVVNVPVGCGRCEFCKQGILVSCKDRGKRGVTIFGSDAELMTAPGASLLALPDEMSYIAGMLMACNVGTAYQAIKRLAVSGRDSVVIFGAGPVGCSTLMLTKATGARSIVVDVPAAVYDLTSGRGVDVGIDTSGAASAQQAMFQCVAYWGRAGFVGMHGGEISVKPNFIIERNMTIIGSAYWPTGIFGEMSRHIMDHKIPVEKLVSHTMPLAQAPEGFRIADAATTGKVAFVWPD